MIRKVTKKDAKLISQDSVCNMMSAFEKFGFDAMIFAVSTENPKAKLGVMSSGEPMDIKDSEAVYLCIRRLCNVMKEEIENIGLTFEYSLGIDKGRASDDN